MSAANKAKGSRWETDIENYLNESGIKARRLPRAGAKDIGDVAIELAKTTIVVEAKNVRAANMAGWLEEAATEAGHYEAKYDVATIPVVITKARGRGPHAGRVTLMLEDFCCLLKWNGLA